MHPYIDFAEYEQLAPGVIPSLRELSKAVESLGLDKMLLELIKIRVSQINGCAFCLQLHLNKARQLNVAHEKIDLLPTWQESGFFSKKEAAALAWSEALTRMADQAITETIYNELKLEFSTQEIASLTAAIGLINAWNRIAGSLRFAPPIPKHP
ncbi:MAG: carboxymuconolactone decarboxylase family protein [Proteobacteria bacterium]|nr:carboxymuconolactone decarboxylase family protein [Pseudomonadota bacterium]